jgi:hypothetical protein
MDELEAILETGGAAAVEIAASAMAERGGVAAKCPNCNHPLIGPYCAICGQPHNTHRRTLGHLLHEFFKDIVSFDSRILRTARALLFQPGELPKSFREGRTQPYVPSIRLYLFVSLLFFLFLSATGLAFVELRLEVERTVYTHDAAGHVFRNLNGRVTAVPGLKSDMTGKISLMDPRLSKFDVPTLKADGIDSDNNVSTNIRFFQRIGGERSKLPTDAKANVERVREEMIKDNESQGSFMRGLNSTLARLEADPAALNGPLTTWIPRVLFVLLPLFAAVLALFYVGKRKEFLFVDHLVFSLTIHTFVFVVLILAAVLAQLITGEWVALVAWLAMSLYLFLSLKRFYGQGWWRTSLKFIGIAFVYSTFFLFPALLSALVISLVAGS